MPGVVGGVADEPFDDEESVLSQPPADVMRSNGGGAWRQQSSAAPATGSTHERATTLLSTAPADLAARFTQRRVQQQKRTIRLLMILLGVVTLLSIIVIAAMISHMVGTQAAQSANQPQSTATDKNDRSAASTKDKANQKPATSSASNANAPASQPLERAEPAQTLPAGELQTPEIVAGTSFREDHERAAALLIEARKDERALKDRIRDCEQAVDLLKNIKAKAPPAQRPDGIAQEIADAEKLLERLKLQEFFP